MKQKRRPISTIQPKKRVKKTGLTETKTSLPSPPVQTAKTPLSSISLAQMLSGFLTFRSTVKDLSTSLQKMESIMDNTYQFFHLAQQFMGKKSIFGNQRRPLFPLPKNPGNFNSTDSSLPDEEIPVINLPKNMGNIGNPLLGRLLRNMDLNQMMSLMQSPLVQKILSGFFSRGNTIQTSRTDKNRKKQG